MTSRKFMSTASIYHFIRLTYTGKSYLASPLFSYLNDIQLSEEVKMSLSATRDFFSVQFFFKTIMYALFSFISMLHLNTVNWSPIEIVCFLQDLRKASWACDVAKMKINRFGRITFQVRYFHLIDIHLMSDLGIN